MRNQQLTATCGSAGLFLSELSRSRPGYNFLGIDIKDEYVQRALSRLDAQGACYVVPLWVYLYCGSQRPD
jgi:tRNA G46 methylase TrmB